MAPLAGPEFETAVKTISDIVRRCGVGSLFVTWESDPHCDHEAASALAKAVRRQCPDLKLWAYPIWGWHLDASAETGQPAPQGYRLDISTYRVRKEEAIAKHASQMAGVIDDDPSGFQLDAASLAPFLGQFEYFIEVPV